MGAHDVEKLDLPGVGIHKDPNSRRFIYSISKKNEKTKGKLLDKTIKKEEEWKKFELYRTCEACLAAHHFITSNFAAQAGASRFGYGPGVSGQLLALNAFMTERRDAARA